MLRNYLKIIFRNVVRNKGYSFINITGFAIGLSICTLIIMWVQNEFNFNQFHDKIENIYLVPTNMTYGENAYQTYGTVPALGPAMKAEHPEVLKFSRWQSKYGMLVTYGDHKFKETLNMVDPDFFDIFSFPLIQGDYNQIFSEVGSIVISKKTALKYFGSENPVGKMLVFDNEHNAKIAGVMDNFPVNSTFRFDIVASIEMVRGISGEEYIDTWYNCSFPTYVLLDEQADYQELSNKISGRILQSTPESPNSAYLYPFSKIYLYSIGGTGGRIDNVKLFSILAIGILLIAIINFINLTTARSTNRAKEICLRKVVGANKSILMRQFFFESLVYSFIALLTACLLVEISLPILNTITYSSFSFNLFSNKVLLFGLLGITLFAGITSGIYPALILSSFNPVTVLKGSFVTGTNKSWFRRILVVFQFSVSIFLIIGTIFIFLQHKKMTQMDIGYDQNQIVYLSLDDALRDNYDAFKTELLKNSKIEYVTRSTHLPSGIYWNGGSWDWDGKNPDINPLVTYLGVDYDFLETFKMEMASGQFYSEDYVSQENDVIINEAFAILINDNVQEVVGSSLFSGDEVYKVTGVIKDFNYQSVRQGIEPLLLTFKPENDRWYLSTRISSSDMPATLDFIKETSQNYSINYIFDHNFLDETINNLYYRESQFGKLFFNFSIFAILVSCLGLIGLVSFTVEQKTKEIGIRKIMGASIISIVKLFSKEHLLLVLAANIVSWPLAYYYINNWLTNFASRVNIEISVFIFVGILSLIMAIIVISFQTIKAALANPVDAIKYE